MKIAGLQKVSTIDYPGEICCTIFLWGCNFRCGFCYNPALVIEDEGEATGYFSEEKILEFLSKRIGKLDGVCITGGEPLMSLDFSFVKKIKDMGFKIKVDTNGSFPNRLREMIDLGLVDYVAMDVKACREDYCKVAGVDVCFEDVEESMRIVNDFEGSVLEVGDGKGRGEFRTTVVSGLHDSKNLVRMGKWMNDVCGGKPERFFLQGFKKNSEGMIDEDFENEPNVGERDLNELKKSIEGFFEEVGVR